MKPFLKYRIFAPEMFFLTLGIASYVFCEQLIYPLPNAYVPFLQVISGPLSMLAQEAFRHEGSSRLTVSSVSLSLLAGAICLTCIFSYRIRPHGVTYFLSVIAVLLWFMFGFAGAFESV